VQIAASHETAREKERIKVKMRRSEKNHPNLFLKSLYNSFLLFINVVLD